MLEEAIKSNCATVMFVKMSDVMSAVCKHKNNNNLDSYFKGTRVFLNGFLEIIEKIKYFERNNSKI